MALGLPRPLCEIKKSEIFYLTWTNFEAYRMELGS